MKKENKNYTRNFFLPEDQSLFDYDYVFSASAMWVELGMQDVEATFDLTVRHLPKKRNFLLFAGLEEIVQGILNWKFTPEDINFLLERGIITEKFVPFLKNFKFSGDVFAMPEGTVFFPQEPVVRITGKLWQINLFTFFLMNALTSNTIFASKLARGFLAADDKIYVATCSPVRGHAHEASLKMGRAAYLFGSASGMVPGWARKFDIQYESKARAFHAFIKSFPTEIEAMRAAASIFPDCSVMTDTYEPKQGLKNAITVALEQKEKGNPVFSAMFIDSGETVEDYAKQSLYVRGELDKAGLQEVKITVAGNFEEYKIAKLVELKAPVDKVILGTELIVPGDDPKLEVVLKMAEFVRGGATHPTAKLAQGKISYPGIKQVYRTFESEKLAGDTIGVEGEQLGEPLLRQYIAKGKLVSDLPSLDAIQGYVTSQIKMLPDELRTIEKFSSYDVRFSPALEKLLQEFKKKHITIEADEEHLL